MSKQGYSRKSGFGKTTHYDSRGKKIGYSQESGFGKTTHYDSRGKKIGYSQNAGFGTIKHYDKKGKNVGKTYDTGFGTEKHYNNKGRQMGYSYKSSNSSSHYKGEGGCYIATCIYETYDCPELWTLRRFRDNYLQLSFLGRTFIKIYYYISPKVVELFGNNTNFRKYTKAILDSFTKMLKSNGFSDDPYKD